MKQIPCFNRSDFKRLSNISNIRYGPILVAVFAMIQKLLFTTFSSEWFTMK